MELCTILVALVIGALAFLYYQLTKSRGHLETLGIPVDPPNLLLGSSPLQLHKHLLHEYQLERFKQLGVKTYGRYEGITPNIVTIDPELKRSILVKNFASFSEFLNVKVPDKHTTLDVSGGAKWKSLRKGMSPTFSTGKLKGLLEPLSECTDHLLSYIEEKFQENDSKVLDLKKIFSGYALDCIARCAFSIRTDALRNDRSADADDHPLVSYGRAVATADIVHDWTENAFWQLFWHLPDSLKLCLGPMFPPAFDKLTAVTDDLMRQREEAGVAGQPEDFLARLMEMKESRDKDQDAGQPLLTNELISAQGGVFFLAGYETTSNTMTTLCYNLAKHPDVQERVFEEVRAVLRDHEGKIDHETIQDMEYLEAAIEEDLRLFPPAVQTVRTCVQDCEVVPGMMLKKGTLVYLPIYASHKHPDFFPDPEEFRPERFLKDSKDEIIPFTHMPFGGGPRLCIGKRFAMTEMKMTMARLLAKYRLEATHDGTKLQFSRGSPFLMDYTEMRVRLVRRTEEHEE